MKRMADAIADNRTQNLWKEMKKIQRRNNLTPAGVDSASSDGDISYSWCSL